MIVCQLFLLTLYQLSQPIKVPASPCSNLFSYRVHPDNNKQIIGYIQLNGFKPNDDVFLAVKISSAARLTNVSGMQLNLFE